MRKGVSKTPCNNQQSILPSFDFEKSLLKKQQKKNYLALDEVGRGCVFGPVTVAGILLDTDTIVRLEKLVWLKQVKDSKKILQKKRDELYEEITEHLPYFISHVSCGFIEQYNINKAIQYAIYRNTLKAKIFLTNLNPHNELDYLLIDGNYKFNYPNIRMPQEIPPFFTKVKGDLTCTGISMASIVAKVSRDNMLTDASDKYKNYFIEKNKGYGTPQHLAQIKKFGLTKLHRKSFLKKYL